MTLKLSVGLSKKIGKPGFSSLGATCNVELDLNASLVNSGNAVEFRRQVRQAFDQCRHAVDEELARDSDQIGGQGHRNGHSVHQNANDRKMASSNGQYVSRVATPNQIRAIRAIANKRHLDLVAELTRRFNVDSPDELSIRQASEMIDAIKPKQD